jgi:hypothetical protein
MRSSFLWIGCLSFLLTACLDNTQEITLNENGGGVFASSTDMGDLLGLARQMGASQSLAEFRWPLLPIVWPDFLPKRRCSWPGPACPFK